MSCLKPVSGLWLTSPETGETYFKYTRFPYSYTLNHNEIGIYKGNISSVIPVPCGKCINCRLDYSRQWANRMMLEFDHTKKAVFLTLTLNDDNLPISSSGLPTTDITGHISPFNKRLRYYYSDKQVRFYAVSEYGSKTNRPHYHGIYFGLSLDDFPDIRLLKMSKHGFPIYISEKLDKIWRLGHVFIAHVSWQTCAYVARYNLKKIGKNADYKKLGIEPERSLMSRDPGIGGYYLEDNPEYLEAFAHGDYNLPIKDEYGLKRLSSVYLPRSILKSIDKLSPELYNEYKLKTKDAFYTRFCEEISKTDLNESDYLSGKAERKNKKMRNFERSVV